MGCSIRFGGELRQPEIENLCLPTVGNEYVAWFDVAMDNALRVCRLQGVGDLYRYMQQLFCFQRASVNLVFQLPAFEQFHRDEMVAFILVDVVDSANVRMIQRRCRSSFTP